MVRESQRILFLKLIGNRNIVTSNIDGDYAMFTVFVCLYVGGITRKTVAGSLINLPDHGRSDELLKVWYRYSLFPEV